MTGRRKWLTGILLASAVTLAAHAEKARAADIEGQGLTPGYGLVLACENGRNYPVRPSAVSDEGDLVTGYIVLTGNHRGVPIRLIPMGDGYRYAGRGIWFDGVNGTATLNWGTRGAVPCTLQQG